MQASKKIEHQVLRNKKISRTTQRKEKAGAKLIDFVWYNGLWTSISSILPLTIYLLPCARHRSNGLCFSPRGTSVLVDDDQ